MLVHHACHNGPDLNGKWDGRMSKVCTKGALRHCLMLTDDPKIAPQCSFEEAIVAESVDQVWARHDTSCTNQNCALPRFKVAQSLWDY